MKKYSNKRLNMNTKQLITELSKFPEDAKVKEISINNQGI